MNRDINVLHSKKKKRFFFQLYTFDTHAHTHRSIDNTSIKWLTNEMKHKRLEINRSRNDESNVCRYLMRNFTEMNCSVLYCIPSFSFAFTWIYSLVSSNSSIKFIYLASRWEHLFNWSIDFSRCQQWTE